MKEYPNFSANLRYALSGIRENDLLGVTLHGGTAYKREEPEIESVTGYIEKYREVNSLKFEYHFSDEAADTFQGTDIMSDFLGINTKGKISTQEEYFLAGIAPLLDKKKFFLRGFPLETS